MKYCTTTIIANADTTIANPITQWVNRSRDACSAPLSPPEPTHCTPDITTQANVITPAIISAQLTTPSTNGSIRCTLNGFPKLANCSPIGILVVCALAGKKPPTNAIAKPNKTDHPSCSNRFPFISTSA
jgi:hypothetical protein